MGKFRTFWSKVKTERGFSIVQVMVAFALMGVLSMFMMGVFDQQNKMSSRVKTDQELNDLRSLLATLLKNPTLCEMNMGHPKGQDLDHIMLENGEAFAAVNERFRNSSLMVKRMRILSDSELKPGTNYSVSSTDGFTTIVFRVVLQKLNKSYGGQDISIDFEIPVYMGEVLSKAGPTASNVKSQCFDSGMKVADSLYRHKPEYNGPGEDPLYCPNSYPTKCFGFCVRYTGPNMKVLYCAQ
jgi:hypothetical protein